MSKTGSGSGRRLCGSPPAVPVTFGRVYPVVLLFLLWMLIAGVALAIRPVGEVAQVSTHLASAAIEGGLSS